MEPLLVFSLVTGFLIAMSGIVLLSLHCSRGHGFDRNPALPHAVALPRRPVLFSKAERAFYETLRGLIPDHMIFPKVKLGDLIAANQSSVGAEHVSALRRRHVDFVICDITLAPVLAIELDNIKASANGAAADGVTSALAQAALPLIHLPQKPHYLLAELRRLLGPYLAVPRPIL